MAFSINLQMFLKTGSSTMAASWCLKTHKGQIMQAGRYGILLEFAVISSKL